MKKDIHPTYHQVTVTCGGCGSSFTVGSTAAEIHVNVCSECHPFYTGQTQRTSGRKGKVEQFNKKYGLQG